MSQIWSVYWVYVRSIHSWFPYSLRTPPKHASVRRPLFISEVRGSCSVLLSILHIVVEDLIRRVIRHDGVWAWVPVYRNDKRRRLVEHTLLLHVMHSVNVHFVVVGTNSQIILVWREPHFRNNFFSIVEFFEELPVGGLEDSNWPISKSYSNQFSLSYDVNSSCSRAST